MASLIPGYEYDIFISYRQKDNKYDGWITQFVDNLKKELAATFKEEISVYFDVNPHDGLLETHDVDASLKLKLKCLIFIPIISRTYCDPKSFAWEHELKAFVDLASQDQFGLRVKLPNRNVAGRVLPVRIHDLDTEDIKLCESVLGGFLRGVEFIYKEPGVNRPLRSNEDNPGNNLNKTFYRNQVNKVANAVKEIITGLVKGEDIAGKNKPDLTLPWEEVKNEKRVIPEGKSGGGLSKNKLLLYVVSGVIVLVFLGVFAIPKILKRDPVKRLRSSGEKISVAVMPFQNLTNDTTWNYSGEAIQMNLISAFSNTGELRVRQKETIDQMINTKGITENALISSAIAAQISIKLDADIYISGIIQKAGPLIRVDAQLINTKTREVSKSFKVEKPTKQENIIPIIDSLGTQILYYLQISKLIKENKSYVPANFNTSSPSAIRYYISGIKAQGKYDLPAAITWYEKAIAVDSNFLLPKFELISAYSNAGMVNKSNSMVLKLYGKRDQMSEIDKLKINYFYANRFDSMHNNIKYLKQLVELDDNGSYHVRLGLAYRSMNQSDKEIAEFERALEIFRRWGNEFLVDDLVLPALGEAYHRTGQYKKAKRIYKEARKVNPDQRSEYFSWIIRDQAALSLTLGNTAAADRYIKELLTVLKENSFSEADIAYQMALMYKQAGDLDKAEEYGRKALSLEPESPSRMYVLAWFLIDTGRNVNEGLEIIDKALVLRADNYNFLYAKGIGLFKQGKNNEALELLERARELHKPYYSYGISTHIEEVKKAIASQKN